MRLFDMWILRSYRCHRDAEEFDERFAGDVVEPSPVMARQDGAHGVFAQLASAVSFAP